VSALSSANYSYDVASQMSGATYDSMGRITEDNSNSYSWDLASRLTSITASSGTISASYDALGYRLSRTSDGVTRDYIWNHALGLPSISIERQDGDDLIYYVHAPNGALLYSIDAATDARNLFHFDEKGNTLFISDDAGFVIGSYAYSPYGTLLASSGSVDNLYRWQGKYGVMQEGDTALYSVRARYYDSNNMRFLSRDSVEGIGPRQINPYQYAFGNPNSYRDITGKSPERHSDYEEGATAFMEMLFQGPLRETAEQRRARYPLGLDSHAGQELQPELPTTADGRPYLFAVHVGRFEKIAEKKAEKETIARGAEKIAVVSKPRTGKRPFIMSNPLVDIIALIFPILDPYNDRQRQKQEREAVRDPAGSKPTTAVGSQ
jgi:RHS repeat-associated protein